MALSLLALAPSVSAQSHLDANENRVQWNFECGGFSAEWLFHHRVPLDQLVWKLSERLALKEPIVVTFTNEFSDWKPAVIQKFDRGRTRIFISCSGIEKIKGRYMEGYRAIELFVVHMVAHALLKPPMLLEFPEVRVIEPGEYEDRENRADELAFLLMFDRPVHDISSEVEKPFEHARRLGGGQHLFGVDDLLCWIHGKEQWRLYREGRSCDEIYDELLESWKPRLQELGVQPSWEPGSHEHEYKPPIAVQGSKKTKPVRERICEYVPAGLCGESEKEEEPTPSKDPSSSDDRPE